MSESERLTQALDRGFYSLLFLAKALGKHNIGSKIELSILSNNVQDVVGIEALCPEKAAVLGPCLVIRRRTRTYGRKASISSSPAILLNGTPLRSSFLASCFTRIPPCSSPTGITSDGCRRMSRSH